MKSIFICYVLACCCLWGCTKYLPRNFYNDPNNPGLSVFTSRSYNIMSAYINGVPYVNPYICDCQGYSQTWFNSPVSVLAKHTGSMFDSLFVSWQIQDSNYTPPQSPYNYLTLVMPVQKGFSKNDFQALNGQRFLMDTVDGVQAVLSDAEGYPLNINPYYYYGTSLHSFIGPAGVYFTQIQLLGPDSLRQYQFSGLFEANINDTLHITKGRFDFLVAASDLNF